jgi:hypothetical protein
VLDSRLQKVQRSYNRRVIPLSVLDLVPVRDGSTASAALREAVDLARLTERLGYTRYWFAEHHSMGSIASSAPEILIGHIAAATTTIRVGSGGIMLPNHTALRVAEVFHTLEALHPGRIDLGRAERRAPTPRRRGPCGLSTASSSAISSPSCWRCRGRPFRRITRSPRFA